MSIPAFLIPCLIILTALVHSVLGERLIFKGWRDGPPSIPRAHRGIIWASWHVLSLLGVMVSGVMAAHTYGFMTLPASVLILFSVMFLVGGLLIAVATRGRHPAWIVFTALAALIGLID